MKTASSDLTHVVSKDIAALPKYPFRAECAIIEGLHAVVPNGMGALCGYVAVPKEDVPLEWHGHYDADGLQYLQIHGGITYCKVGGGDDEARNSASKAAYAATPEPGEHLSLDERLSGYAARRKAADDAALTVPYTHVVFGFDCAHSGDESNPLLRQTEHVMALAKQMGQLLRDYAASIVEWRAADRETRIRMIDEINSRAPHKSGMGFGALIGALAGAPEFGEDAARAL